MQFCSKLNTLFKCFCWLESNVSANLSFSFQLQAFPTNATIYFVWSIELLVDYEPFIKMWTTKRANLVKLSYQNNVIDFIISNYSLFVFPINDNSVDVRSIQIEICLGNKYILQKKVSQWKMLGKPRWRFQHFNFL